MGYCVSCASLTEYSYEYYSGQFDGNKRSTIHRGALSYSPVYKNICRRKDFACTPCIKASLKAESIAYKRDILSKRKSMRKSAVGLLSFAAVITAKSFAWVWFMDGRLFADELHSALLVFTLVFLAVSLAAFAYAAATYARARKKHTPPARYDELFDDDEPVGTDIGSRFVMLQAAELEATDGFTYFTHGERVGMIV